MPRKIKGSHKKLVKKGCLFLLCLWIALSLAYHHLSRETWLAGHWYIPVLVALSAVLFVANIMNLWSSLAHQRAAARPPERWRDGDLVGVSGRIQLVGAELSAPFSGEPAAVVEYEVKKIRRGSAGRSSTTVAEYQGWLMGPCAIFTLRGPVSLIGFPALGFFRKQRLDAGAWRRAATYLASAAIEKYPPFPESLKFISERLRVTSEMIRINFADPEARLLDDVRGVVEADSAHDDEEPGHSPVQAAESSSAEGLFEHLTRQGYTLHERGIPNGSEVTAFGTWRAERRALDVGGFTMFRHQLHPGDLDRVVTKRLSRAFFGMLFWGSTAACLHAWAGYEAGLPIEELAQKLRALLPALGSG